eukprot:scaffold34637_cov112-Isochrysis_galbana.AAC.2
MATYRPPTGERTGTGNDPSVRAEIPSVGNSRSDAVKLRGSGSCSLVVGTECWSGSPSTSHAVKGISTNAPNTIVNGASPGIDETVPQTVRLGAARANTSTATSKGTSESGAPVWETLTSTFALYPASIPASDIRLAAKRICTPGPATAPVRASKETNSSGRGTMCCISRTVQLPALATDSRLASHIQVYERDDRVAKVALGLLGGKEVRKCAPLAGKKHPLVHSGGRWRGRQ